MRSARSVLRDDRATPTVVDAHRDEIDVLTDPDGGEGTASRGGEGQVPVAHEQVIVFEGGRPVRSKAVFEADANRAAPTGFVDAAGEGAGRVGEGAIAIPGNGGTALDVEQGAVEGPADLTGEQAKCID